MQNEKIRVQRIKNIVNYQKKTERTRRIDNAIGKKKAKKKTFRVNDKRSGRLNMLCKAIKEKKNWKDGLEELREGVDLEI